MDECKVLRTRAVARAGSRCGDGGVREFIVQRIVEGDALVQRRGAGRLHLGAEEFFLILPCGLSRRQWKAWSAVALRAVVEAAAPGVGVHHDDGAGGCGDELSLPRSRSCG